MYPPQNSLSVYRYFLYLCSFLFFIHTDLGAQVSGSIEPVTGHAALGRNTIRHVPGYVTENRLKQSSKDQENRMAPAVRYEHFTEKSNHYFQKMLADRQHEMVWAYCSMIAWSRSLADTSPVLAMVADNVRAIKQWWGQESCPCADVIPEWMW